jgi:hypothetical protein
MEQYQSRKGLFFDRKDYELLKIVNDVLGHKDPRSLKKLLIPYLHPHGIKEMAATTGLRIAYAVIKLFRSLERDNAEDRLHTLRALRDEVFVSSGTELRKNRARVLLQIMKELVRAEDEQVKLQLARDFREAATGKPKAIYRQLIKYHLVEMPEEWNQIAFDDHVHDANTKGRKSATHLIMDAWIKGIRRLRVIYYNYVPSEVAMELAEAAEIMDVSTRVGIEYCARFRDRYVRFIWTPRGFNDAKDFVEFLNKPRIRDFMAEGSEVSEYQQAYTFSVLEAFNDVHRAAINQEFGIELPILSNSDLLALVGTGQPSLHHLSKLIHDHLLRLFHLKLEELRKSCIEANEQQYLESRELVERMNGLDIEAITERYLRPYRNPTIHNPFIPSEDDGAPPLLKLSPPALLKRLDSLHVGYRITLNLSGLRAEDVLELLYDCEGSITRLEIFNFKDHAFGNSKDTSRIQDLQVAINSGNAVQLKRCVRNIVQNMGEGQDDQKQKLSHILDNLDELRDHYRNTPLKSRIGTDSTGGSSKVPGMGLVVLDTLPARCRREMKKISCYPARIPVTVEVFRQRTYRVNNGYKTGANVYWRALTGHFFRRYKDDWVVGDYLPTAPERSNLRALGGVSGREGNKLRLDCSEKSHDGGPPHLRYLNTHVKNCLKILLGFVPAFATFALTKDWWVLAYLGAFIWFGITGLRNIIQSVLGAGGLHRSPLMRWTEYVSWNRLADSLMYTGFSVPLLDYFVKSLVLQQQFDVTVHTNPVVLYSTMAVVNGVYLASHNLFRGLPKAAAMGNLGRTVFSIPLALLFNLLIGVCLTAAGVPGVDEVLQKWAAIISKLASDIVAAFIEGYVDRGVNLRERYRDYRDKIKQVFDTYAHLELQHPQEEIFSVLEASERSVCAVSRKEESLNLAVIVNALDLMYFWMYQPRARHTLKSMMLQMNAEERKIFMLSQVVLQRERDISQLFLDGLVGKNFSRALAFYLARWRNYLDDLHRMASRFAAAEASPSLQAETQPGRGLNRFPVQEDRADFTPVSRSLPD